MGNDDAQGNDEEDEGAEDSAWLVRRGAIAVLTEICSNKVS